MSLKNYTPTSRGIISLNRNTLPGLLLLAGGIIAFLGANLSFSSGYLAFWQQPLSIGWGTFALEKSLQVWINDGLLAIFFLYVGLEMKREVMRGSLQDVKSAVLPLFAAFGGMAVPVALFFLFLGGNPGAEGFGVPMATDIAFAFGILALLGSRVPVALKAFLMAFAVIDDLGAILVIAFAYTETISWTYLALAAGVLGTLFALNRFGVRNVVWYLIPGAILWLAVLKSGVHATLAGVALAAFIPMGEKGGHSPAEHLEHQLKPWVLYLILPLFALANAGETLSEDMDWGSNLIWSVAGALVLGKFLGVVGATWLALKLKLGRLPKGLNMRMVAGAGWLGGVGFTMALFIAGLAYGAGHDLVQAKLGILLGSLIAGIVGYMWLRAALRKPKAVEKPPIKEEMEPHLFI